MLIRLAVRDLAVIEAAEVDVATGFTVLTGETGAGKSLLVDALGLVLGDRGAATLVRSGAARASVTAEFDAPELEAVQTSLRTRELPIEETLILHRQIGADGRSRGWVNGMPVPLSVLREIGEPLVEIHGQHEHHALAGSAYQRRLLDTWGEAQTQAQAVETAAQTVQAARKRLADARETGQGREARVEFLRFQIEELDRLAPRSGEYEDLLVEDERLRHREKLAQALSRAIEDLEDGEHPATSALADAREALAQLPTATGLAETVDLIAQAETLVDEAARQIRSAAQTEANPERVDSVNDRIARYQALARKHGVEPAALAVQFDALATELEALAGGADTTRRLESEVAETAAAWREAAAALSRRRKAAAPKLAKAVTAAVRELGMPHARFQVRLEAADPATCPGSGAEHVRFEIATNEGQAPGPIARVASGGELSRVALAVEVLARTATVPVMIFDEIDAGVSGRVAELVGRRLKMLAQRCQVLCVTHLPQVAALADHHLSVTKSTRGAATATDIHQLDSERRIEAVAQMLGGVRVTESARTHARELIEQSAS